jgi:hypothetical protein
VRSVRAQVVLHIVVAADDVVYGEHRREPRQQQRLALPPHPLNQLAYLLQPPAAKVRP